MNVPRATPLGRHDVSRSVDTSRCRDEAALTKGRLDKGLRHRWHRTKVQRGHPAGQVCHAGLPGNLIRIMPA